MSTRTIQGKLWSVAPHYWANHFEPLFVPIYKKALDQLQLDEETLLLDAGCGSGLFSSMAIDAGAQVIGIDAAPGLLEVARIRNPRNNFLEEDLEALPFRENSFDVVAGFNSFQYAENFENALTEARRVLRPEGRLVIGMWDKPEMNDATTILKAINALLPASPVDASSPFALSEDGKMEEMFEQTGLKLVSKTKVACPFLYGSQSDAVKSFMGTAPAAAAISNSNKKTVQQAIEKAMRPYCVCEEFYFLQNNFLVFIVEK